MRIRKRVGRNIITSIPYMNIVLIYHIRDVIKRMRKYAWSDVSRSSIRFTYSSVARHIGPCICHNSQTYTWNDVIPYKERIIRVFFSIFGTLDRSLYMLTLLQEHLQTVSPNVHVTKGLSSKGPYCRTDWGLGSYSYRLTWPTLTLKVVAQRKDRT